MKKYSIFKVLKIFLLFSFFRRIFAQRDWEHFGATDFYAEYLNDTSKLFQELFKNRNYDSMLSPIYANMPKNWTTTNQPRFRLNCMAAYSKVIDVDAQSQIFSIMIDLWLQWQDIRLSWDREHFGNIDYFWVNPQMIWLPEHSISNAKFLDEIYPLNLQQAKLWHNGSVTVIRSYYAEISCDINVATFPFDRQRCQVGVLSRNYDEKHHEMFVGVNTDFPPSRTGNGEWDCVKIIPAIEHWGGEIMEFDVLTFTYILYRVPNFYIYVIALPCLVLTTLSIFGMFWTPNSDEQQIAKLSIGLTSLVSMTVLLQMVSEAIPKTIRFPLLGIYVVIDVLIIAVACVIVVAFTLQQCEKHKKLQESKGNQNVTLWRKALRRLLAPHILCHLLFQALNFINFIVLMSFWRNDHDDDK